MFNFLRRIMNNIMFGNDGYPIDEFRPERPTDEQGNILAKVPGSTAQLTGSIEPVEESADIFRGKSFSYIAGDFIGTKVKAERMVKENNNYFVYFSNSQRHSVKDIQSLLIEVDPYDDFMNIKPNSLQQNNDRHFNNQQVQQAKPVEFDPVIEILKKRKKKPVSLTITLELDLPPKELYNVLIDDYENVDDKIIDYLFTPENIVELKGFVKNSMVKYYGNNK